MKKILLIEDDRAIADIERDFLEIEGFAVTVCADGMAGMEAALTRQYDLILLDLMLPGKNGYEICRAIRSKINIPILIVTARTGDADKVRGLGLGADDYIPKPFSPTELVARIKANIAQYDRLKHSAVDEERELDFGDLLIKPRMRRVYAHGEEIELKNKEYELLLFLASNAEIVFSKEQIYERIWGMGAFGDIKTVAVHIGRLREKIEKASQYPAHIQTVWGVGYRFTK